MDFRVVFGILSLVGAGGLAFWLLVTAMSPHRLPRPVVLVAATAAVALFLLGRWLIPAA